MKKVLLLLVGIVTIGMYPNNQVDAKEEEQQKVVELKDAEENDGEESDVMPQESKQRSLTKSADTRTIDIKNFMLQ